MIRILLIGLASVFAIGMIACETESISSTISPVEQSIATVRSVNATVTPVPPTSRSEPLATTQPTSSITSSNDPASKNVRSPKVDADNATTELTYLSDAWSNVWLCKDSKIESLDLTTGDTQVCSVSVEFVDSDIVVRSTGIPNHDYESTLGCCASDQNSTWTIPIEPKLSDESPTYAPERGPIAFTVSGVAIYGPEEGPGGDAVALEYEHFIEDRQQVDLGVCGGHSGPNGQYHYHYDSNCMHWHPDAEGILGYDLEAIATSIISEVIGFALDGFPIYSSYENEPVGETIEVTSSYRLKPGENGYNGIDDYNYVKGLGHLDECNGHFGPTPEAPDGIYHYHTTLTNGEGNLGFPYFPLCYKGAVNKENYDLDTLNRGGPPGAGGPPTDQYACIINPNGFCIFTGSPHQTGLKPGTDEIVNNEGRVLFNIDEAIATDASGKTLAPTGKPASDGDNLKASSNQDMSDDEKAFHKVMAIMFPIRNALMYNISYLSTQSWKELTTELRVRGIKETSFTSGTTPKDNYYSREDIFDLAKNPDGKDIHHPIMKFLEESGLYLLCHVTTDEFNVLLKEAHPEGHDPCGDNVITTKVPFNG